MLSAHHVRLIWASVLFGPLFPISLSGKPVIISGLFDDWPALRKWTATGLAPLGGRNEVSVDLTPDGHGDAARRLEDKNRYFVQPLQLTMPFEDAMENVVHSPVLAGSGKGGGPAGVYYIQKQNDSFRQEYEVLLPPSSPKTSSKKEVKSCQVESSRDPSQSLTTVSAPLVRYPTWSGGVGQEGVWSRP